MGTGTGVDTAAAAVLDAPLAGLDDDAVLDALREVERARRRLDAVDHRLVAELEVRSVAARRLQRGTAGLLAQVLHLDRAEARARVAAAADLGPRTNMTGEPQEPRLPRTAAGLAAGSLSSAHARVVRQTLAQVPAAVPPTLLARAEADLAEAATHLTPAELTQVGRRLLAHLDPDGRLTDDADRSRRRGVSIGPQAADGMSSVRGLLTPAARAVLDAALASLAAPGPGTDDAGHPVADPRTAAQRTHDGLVALAHRAMAAGTVGTSRGTPATVLVTVDAADLERRAGRARTGTGGWLDVREALDLAGDASWVLCGVDDVGQPLRLSRERRLASRAQRQALLVRDGGCTRPGCDAPAAWCEAHHLVGWRDGGPTDLENLALVCPFDHHLITESGYEVALDAATGRVTWTAPGWLDPDRVPRVNGVHRPAPGAVPRVDAAPDRPPAHAPPARSAA